MALPPGIRPDHLADVILRHYRGKEWLSLRRRTLAYWDRVYGADVGAIVRKLVAAGWRKLGWRHESNRRI